MQSSRCYLQQVASRLVIFRLCVAVLAGFLEECRNQILPIERQHNNILFQMPQRKLQVGFYNEQGNWVAEPPRPSPSIQAVHSLSVVHPVIQDIQDIQDIHPEIQSRNFPHARNGKISNFLSEKTARRSVLQRCSFSPYRFESQCIQSPMEKQPMRQKSTNSSSSSVLQVSKQSQGDQDIQNSTNVSVQSFRDTETDPETTSNADTGDSKKFQVSNFRNDLQRKGEVMLSLPINSTQFHEFCKEAQ